LVPQKSGGKRLQTTALISRESGEEIEVVIAVLVRLAYHRYAHKDQHDGNKKTPAWLAGAMNKQIGVKTIFCLFFSDFDFDRFCFFGFGQRQVQDAFFVPGVNSGSIYLAGQRDIASE
jgi:hypothetical protein